MHAFVAPPIMEKLKTPTFDALPLMVQSICTQYKDPIEAQALFAEFSEELKHGIQDKIGDDEYLASIAAQEFANLLGNDMPEDLMDALLTKVANMSAAERYLEIIMMEVAVHQLQKGPQSLHELNEDLAIYFIDAHDCIDELLPEDPATVDDIIQVGIRQQLNVWFKN